MTEPRRDDQPRVGAAPTMTEAEAAEARKARMESAHAHMTNRFLEDRALAYHTHAFDSDEGVATMLADYDRMVAEQTPPPDPPIGEGQRR